MELKPADMPSGAPISSATAVRISATGLLQRLDPEALRRVGDACKGWIVQRVGALQGCIKGGVRVRRRRVGKRIGQLLQGV